MQTAIDRLKEDYIHIDAMCVFLGITKKRCQDLLSLHKTNGQFMPAYKASAGVYYFKYDDVVKYLESRVSTSETLSD